MFKDWMEQKPNWHYRDAYDNFVKLYPRAATGNHGKRWSTTHLSARFAKGSNENSRLPFHGIHRSDYRSTRFEMENLTDQSGKANISKEEHKETTSLIVTSQFGLRFSFFRMRELKNDLSLKHIVVKLTESGNRSVSWWGHSQAQSLCELDRFRLHITEEGVFHGNRINFISTIKKYI